MFKSSTHGLMTILFLALSLLLIGGCGQAEEQPEDADADQAATGDAPPGEGASAAPTTAPAPARGVTSAPAQGEKPAVRGGEALAAGGATDDAPSIPEGMVLVPAGQELTVTVTGRVSTEDAQPGDKVRGDIDAGFFVGDEKVPAGKWTLVGQVLSVTQPTRKDDVAGELEIAFETVRTEDGTKFPMRGYVTAFAGSARKRNVGVVAGAAAVGAILGKAEGGDTKDAVLGAAVGAAAGAGIVRALPGKHMNIEAGDQLTVTLVEDALMPYRR